MNLIQYTPKAQKYIEAKNELLDNAKNFHKGREKIIEGFKKGIFPLNHDYEFEGARHKVEAEKNIRNKNGLIDYNKFMRLTYLKQRDISDELVRKHFLVQELEDLFKRIKELQNNSKINKQN